MTILGGSNITTDSDCSHEIKRRLLLGRKVMTQPRLGQEGKEGLQTDRNGNNINQASRTVCVFPWRRMEVSSVPDG